MYLVPVAQRMYWASWRQTKRVEDVAYCLLGIFDINMPLIYGEGSKASIRLQNAIARNTNDLSLFAWCSQPSEMMGLSGRGHRGIFARSPRDFAGSEHIEPVRDLMLNEHGRSTVTDRDVLFHTPVWPAWEEDKYFMNLYCHDTSPRGEAKTSGSLDPHGYVVIAIVKTETGFVRCKPDVLMVCGKSLPYHLLGTLTEVRGPKHISFSDSRQLGTRLVNAFKFQIECPVNTSVKLFNSLGPPSTADDLKPWMQSTTHVWDEAAQVYLTGSSPSFTGMLWLHINSNPQYRWPHVVRILFEFKQHYQEAGASIKEDFASSEPWVSLVAGKHERIDFDDAIADGWNVDLDYLLRKHSQSMGHYRPTLVAMSAYINSCGTNLNKLPRELTVYPISSTPSPSRIPELGLKLTVSISSQRDATPDGHLITLRFEPVVSSEWSPPNKQTAKLSRRAVEEKMEWADRSVLVTYYPT